MLQIEHNKIISSSSVWSYQNHNYFMTSGLFYHMTICLYSIFIRLSCGADLHMILGLIKKYIYFYTKRAKSVVYGKNNNFAVIPLYYVVKTKIYVHKFISN
jgi:hypothetical protein